ncbi:Ribosomal subunit 39S [Ceratocystis platani]|uniref:Large ribosomal subunit protein mL50 n=1 Tax=Ceratocystis fimbriata f. sp. platani TaxID=88771 RepID=A0A0F8CTP9_CERFI|nr:Ribosomal subunit 39S [Ceratocystis platani]
MSLPNTIRRLPQALRICANPGAASKVTVSLSALRSISTTPSRHIQPNRKLQAIFGKGSAGEEAKAEEEAKRRELLAAREQERNEALAQAAQLDQQQLVSGDELDGFAESKLVVPGEYLVAPTPAEAEQMAYVPAENASELESVGNLNSWWDHDGHWGPESHLAVFATPRSRISDEVMTVLVRQAVVEALVYRAKGEATGMTQRWARVSKEVAYKTSQITFEVKEGGDVALTGEISEVYGALNSSNGVTAEEESFSQEEAAEMVKTFDSTWQQISLADPVLKFAISKRIYQLTGYLISDSRLHLSYTVGQLLNYLITPPKAKTVNEQIRSSETLKSLPNVRVFSRRITPIDRQIMDGSWKKIEEELRKRKLPIVGHEELGDFAERKWLNIKA